LFQSLLFSEQTTNKKMLDGENYILFLRPSFTGAMKHLHDDVEQIPEFGAEPKLSQAPDRAPDQILPIFGKDTAQTLTFAPAKWHGGRFPTVMVLLAVWLLS
jgi:hypothetical protein